MTTEEMLTRTQGAFDEVFGRDSVLFDLGTDGISEQSITFRLGLHLQSRFTHLHVDCEYNRCGTDSKTDEHVDLEWMKPDVIVHERKGKASNLIVIEAKKSRQWTAGWPDIQEKLRAFTRVPGKYEYRLGLAWRISTSRDPEKHCLVWFWRGDELCRTSVFQFAAQVLNSISDKQEV